MEWEVKDTVCSFHLEDSNSRNEACLLIHKNVKKQVACCWVHYSVHWHHHLFHTHNFAFLLHHNIVMIYANKETFLRTKHISLHLFSRYLQNDGSSKLPASEGKKSVNEIRREVTLNKDTYDLPQFFLWSRIDFSMKRFLM